MTYTDENGQKYELVTHWEGDPMKLIRPIKKQPKWNVTLDSNPSTGDYIRVDLPNIPLDHAQLIKDAVEALMVDIFDKNDTAIIHIYNLIDKVRHALQKGDE